MLIHQDMKLGEMVPQTMNMYLAEYGEQRRHDRNELSPNTSTDTA